MSQITLSPSVTSKTESSRPTAASAPAKNAPVLITEKQVAFGTAVAVSVESHHRRWLSNAQMARLGRVLTQWTESRPYPIHHEAEFFEEARMSREMDRL